MPAICSWSGVPPPGLDLLPATVLERRQRGELPVPVGVREAAVQEGDLIWPEPEVFGKAVPKPFEGRDAFAEDHQAVARIAGVPAEGLSAADRAQQRPVLREVDWTDRPERIVERLESVDLALPVRPIFADQFRHARAGELGAGVSHGVRTTHNPLRVTDDDAGAGRWGGGGHGAGGVSRCGSGAVGRRGTNASADQEGGGTRWLSSFPKVFCYISISRIEQIVEKEGTRSPKKYSLFPLREGFSPNRPKTNCAVQLESP